MQLGTKWNAGFPNGSGAGEQEEYQERSDDEERSYLNDRDDVVSELSVKDDLDRDESPTPAQSNSLHPTKKQGNAAVSRMRKPLPAWLSETPTSTVTASSKAAAEPSRKKRKTAAATKDSKTITAATATAGGSIKNSPLQSSNNGNNNQGGIGSGQGKIVAEVASKAANVATNASMAAAAAAALAAATAATPPVPFVIDKNQKVRKWAKSGNIFQTLGGEVSMPLWTSDQDMLLNEPRPLLVQQALLFLTDGRTYSELARMAVLRDLDVIDLEYQDSLERGSTPGSLEGSPGPTSTALATTATTAGSTGKRKRGYKKLLIPGNDAAAADLSTLEKSESRAGSNDGSKKWLTKRKRVKADNGDSAMAATHSDRDGTPVPATSSPSLSAATVSTKSNGRPVSTPSQRPRKYPCLFEGCGKSFMDKFHLDRHEARHVTEEIVCGIDGCTKAYPSISTVRRHQSIVHKDRKEELDLQRQKQTQVQREQKLQRYKEQQQQKGRMLMGQAQDSDMENRVAEADISESSSTRNSSPRSMDDDEDPDQDQDQEEEEEEEEEEEIEREEAVLVD
ncbi:hypothetical protein BGZ98_004079 [Dissophora globulifera]|nr:hypothetical protein BGZ98_004079 [Dissophora globulifera]